MIRVETNLFDSYERMVFNQAMDIIENHRRALQEAAQGNAEPGRRVVDIPAPQEEEHGEPEAQVVATITPEAVTIHPTPAPVTGGPTASQMTEAVQASINAIGVPATREVLLSFGHGQVMKIDPAQWPEVLESLAAKVVAAR